jgi:hypothetical protein
MPAVPTVRTCVAVPIASRITVAEPDAYKTSPAVVTVFFGIAVDAVSNADFTEAGVAAVVVEVELVESIRVVTP